MALWRLRRREPDLSQPFRIPGGNFGLALVVLPPLGVAALSLAAAVAGAPLYAGLVHRREGGER